MPLLTDAALVSEDVVYEGPLETVSGREAYLARMRAWKAELPKRLDRFAVSDVETWSIEPGEVTARWSCSFIAPLPPTARLRGIPPGLAVLPDERVAVETTLRAALSLDADGRILRHREEIRAGFGMMDAIARYELLTARRPPDQHPVAWYWRVLRETTLEELAFRAEPGADPAELELRFYEMVFRNFLYGLVIGTAVAALYYAGQGR